MAACAELSSITTPVPGRGGRRKGYASLRKGRWSQAGQAYLITTNTDRREPRFLDLWAGREVILSMKAMHGHGLLHSHAFVLMPDHLHWLLTLRREDLATVIQRFKSLSALALNRRCRVRGRVWQPGFHDHPIRSDESMIEIARYIVANPLRAKLVTRIYDYPHWDAEWL